MKQTMPWVRTKRIRYARVGAFLMIYFWVWYLILLHIIQANEWKATPRLP